MCHGNSALDGLASFSCCVKWSAKITMSRHELFVWYLNSRILHFIVSSLFYCVFFSTLVVCFVSNAFRVCFPTKLVTTIFIFYSLMFLLQRSPLIRFPIFGWRSMLRFLPFPGFYSIAIWVSKEWSESFASLQSIVFACGKMRMDDNDNVN